MHHITRRRHVDLSASVTCLSRAYLQISEALQLMAQAVRFLDVRDMPPAPPPVPSPRLPAAPGDGGGGAGEWSGQPRSHMSAELVRTLWPMLEAAPGRLGGSAEIIKQLFLLVGKMLTSLRMVLAQQVREKCFKTQGGECGAVCEA